MTDFSTSAAPARSGMRFKHILLLSVFAFGGGIGASWWLADNYGWLASDAPLASAAPVPAKADPALTPATQILMPLAPPSADSAMAADNAARFGSSQPRAVMTILQASQTPVTAQSLQAELTAIENLLVTGTREETLWATIQREFSELFVLRKSDSPSPAPTQRMLRTHAFVESGNISGAIAEIPAMPGAAAPAVQNWLGRAKAYDQTRKALDTLERSALAAPPIMAAPPAAPQPQHIIIPE
jgi:Mitochondrial inner membrane protein